MWSVNKETGELVVSPFSKFMRETKGRKAGSMIIQNFDFAWDDKTREFIVVEGSKEDRQAYIDSFKDDCGVYNVLKKYAITGDVSLLNRVQGFYGDISDLPVDELNPDKVAQKAGAAVASLAEKLGVDITSEQLASMSVEQINALIEKAVAARVAKTEVKAESKEGE